MPMPQQLPQIPILRIGHPDSRKALFDHQPQQQLRILPIRLLLTHSLRPDLRRVSDPQLELQVAQQTLEPARVSAGFHPHPYGQILLLEFSIKLLGFSRVGQPTFTALAGFCVYKSNLLEARMIVTTYNQHVRLLSSEPFGWFAPPKFTRAWEPTLLWNHYTHRPGKRRRQAEGMQTERISADWRPPFFRRAAGGCRPP